MKKIIFALTLLFTLISCTNITENQKTATVHVSLSQYTPKTISPSQVQESSYQNVESWTITFSDKTAEREDIIYEGVTFSEATPSSFTLPTGTYTATIQGSNTDPSDIIFYDSQTITLTQSQTFNLVFYVTPKKIATGNFEAEFEFTSRTSVTSSATLTSLKTNDVITLETSINEDLTTCTITSTKIPSGFYKFSLKFSYTDTDNVSVENQEVYANNNDDLIEICDDLTTKLTSQIVLPTVTKVFYVTKKEESSGNGQFESLPITLPKAYSKVQDNTKNVKFIFIDSDSIPQIDISQLKENCIYQLELKNKNGYEISNQTESIIVTNLNTTNISITDSISSSKPIKINSILENSNITISTTLDVSLEEALLTRYSILDNENGTKTLKAIIDTPVMLYKYNSTTKSVSYADFATLSETETGTEIYPASVGDRYLLQDYIIDKSNNIFITYYDEDSGNQYIKRITYDNTTNTYEDIQSDHCQINTNYTISQIRNVGDNLYIVATTSDTSTYYLLKGTYSAGSTVSCTEAKIDTNNSILSFYISDDEKTLYTYEYKYPTTDESTGGTSQDYYFIKSYIIGGSPLTFSNSISLLGTTPGTLGSDATTVADMFVVNDFIYLLLADSNYGCILRLSTTLASNTATYSSYPTAGTTVSSDNDSQYFYSPEKIVGIDSDYLLIKDKINTDSSRIVKFSLTDYKIATSKATQY